VVELAFMRACADVHGSSDASFVQEEFPVLNTVLVQNESAVTDEWKGFIYLDLAVIDPVRSCGDSPSSSLRA
jgi:endoglucanase Acf2